MRCGIVKIPQAWRESNDTPHKGNAPWIMLIAQDDPIITKNVLRNSKICGYDRFINAVTAVLQNVSPNFEIIGSICLKIQAEKEVVLSKTFEFVFTSLVLIISIGYFFFSQRDQLSMVKNLIPLQNRWFDWNWLKLRLSRPLTINVGMLKAFMGSPSDPAYFGFSV